MSTPGGGGDSVARGFGSGEILKSAGQDGHRLSKGRDALLKLVQALSQHPKRFALGRGKLDSAHHSRHLPLFSAEHRGKRGNRADRPDSTAARQAETHGYYRYLRP